ncbi:MAG TPA: transposase [Armatimonadota bacterium]|jgi:REP element-mobilizing transposase RayT
MDRTPTDNPVVRLPQRHDCRPRLDSYVYGPSGYVTHVAIGSHRKRPVLTTNPQVAGLICACLEAAAFAQGGRLYCYCLMPDHLHFLVAIDPGGSNVATIVRSFGIRVTMRTKHLCAPPLFQRSFYDSVVREDDDLPERCTYVVNNPVRQELVADWRDYPYTWLSPELGS